MRRRPRSNVAWASAGEIAWVEAGGMEAMVLQLVVMRPSDVGEPEDVLVGGVLGDDEAEAAGDGVGVVAAHEGDEVGSAAGAAVSFTIRPYMVGLFEEDSGNGGVSSAATSNSQAWHVISVCFR